MAKPVALPLAPTTPTLFFLQCLIGVSYPKYLSPMGLIMTRTPRGRVLPRLLYSEDEPAS